MNHHLFTTRSLAALLNVSTRTILRERMAGRLSYKKIRGRIRFTQEEIDEYLQRQTHLSAGPDGREIINTETVKIFSGWR